MWSKDAMTVLIDNYSKHRCLYVAKSANYHNKKTRQRALQAVADEVSRFRPNTTADDVKLKYNTMRAGYVFEYHKVQQSRLSGCPPDEMYQPNLWYYQGMMFLENHISTRRKCESVGAADDPSSPPSPGSSVSAYPEHVVKEEEYDDYPFEDHFIVVGSGEPKVKHSASSESPWMDHLASPSSMATCSSRFPPPNNRRKMDPEASYSAPASTTSRPPPPSPALCGAQLDEDEVFGNYIVTKLRRLTHPAIKQKFQHGILKLIMDAEIEHMQKDN